MWQSEAKAADAQKQLESMQDAAQTAERKMQEQHSKVVENFRQQLAALKVWWLLVSSYLNWDLNDVICG